MGLMHTHSGFAYLWMINSALSVLIAGLVLAVGPKPGLMRAGRVVGQRLELALGGIVGLAGLVLPFVSPLYGWTSGFVWLGLLAFLASTVLTVLGIKPAWRAAQQGRQDVYTRWFGFAVANLTVVYGAFWLMHAKPF